MKKNISLIIVVAIFLFFCFLNLYIFLQRTIVEAAVDSAISIVLFGLFAYGLQFSSRYIQFSREFLGRFLVSHLAGSIVFTAIWLFVCVLILTSVFPNEEYNIFFRSTIPWRALLGILFYFLIQSFIYLIMYYDNYAKVAEEEAELKNLVTESELRSLKFQLNPHFLFNSLNSISALSEINPPLARSMTIKLSDYMRSTLTSNEKTFHPLGEELKNILLYVDIEKIRFSEKFIFNYLCDDAVKKFLVPNMILQPLIENAIKYGTFDAIEQIKIILSANLVNDNLLIRIENDFSLEVSSPQKRGTGTGLENIRRRLFLTYKQHNLMKIEKNENKFIVELKIPLRNVA